MAMIYCLLAIVIQGHNARSIFDDLPPVKIDELSNSQPSPNIQQIIFNPIGKYVTNVHFIHVRIPIHFLDIINDQVYFQQAVNEIRRRYQVSAQLENVEYIIKMKQTSIDTIHANLLDLLNNMPIDYTPNNRKQRFFDLLFGLTGTIFGISNQIQISHINTQIASMQHNMDQMVDIQQLQENHLHKLDLQMKNIDTIIQDFLIHDPAKINAFLDGHIFLSLDIFTKISAVISQMQLRRLSPLLLSSQTLDKLRAHIFQVARTNQMKSFVTRNSDFFQIETSYIWQPHNKTLSLLLHVPLARPEYILDLKQYLPFPLAHDLSANHSITPSVGAHDILAVSQDHTVGKILSQSDLQGAFRMGEFFFSEGRDILQTDLQDTCLGANYLQHLTGIKRYCKFEIQQIREQVFQSSKNQWTIYTTNQFTTFTICPDKQDPTIHTNTPTIIQPSSTISLEPGCKIRLRKHIIYAETDEQTAVNPTFFTSTWNVSTIFPNTSPGQFSEALQSLHDYGLHIVDAADIAGHLKTSSAQSTTAHFTNPLNYFGPLMALIALILISIWIFKKFWNKTSKNNNNIQSQIAHNPSYVNSLEYALQQSSAPKSQYA